MPKEFLPKILFLASIVLQFLIILGIIFVYQAIIVGGTEVILETQPVDPRDLLRGQYVALNYKISQIPAVMIDEYAVNSGDTLYVKLEESANGSWRATSASREKSSEGVFIKGTVKRVNGPQVAMEYGIESYFTSPDDAKKLERESRRGMLRMKVVVGKDGTGVLKEVVDFGGGGTSLFGGGDLADAQTRSRDARRVADLKQIQLGLELYYDVNGKYPVALGDLAPDQLSVVPRDPVDASHYYYANCDTVNSTGYHVAADLESSDNVALTSDNDYPTCGADRIQTSDFSSCDGTRSDRFCLNYSESGQKRQEVVFPQGDIRILVPGAGARWQAGKSYAVSWCLDSSSQFGDVQQVVKLVTTQGYTSQPISNDVPQDTVAVCPQLNTVQWRVPSYVSSGNYRVHVEFRLRNGSQVLSSGVSKDTVRIDYSGVPPSFPSAPR